MTEEKVACRTPTVGKKGVTNIPRWKYESVREAINTILSDGDVPFAQLTRRVSDVLSDDIKSNIGAVGWHVASVKLEMEVRGEIARIPGKTPQVLMLVK